MRNFLETIAVAFGVFSAIPVPQPLWKEENMRYALCAFPLVGLVCAFLWWGWAVLSATLMVPVLLRGAVFCLLPVWVTGGIHLDGYADTCDALASYGDAQKRQEILRDPHCGAFALIRLCAYFVLFFALCTSFLPEKQGLWAMGGAFVLSRSLSALAVTRFPMAKDTGLAHTFAQTARKERAGKVLMLYLLLTTAGMIYNGGLAGAFAAAAGFCVFGYYRWMAEKQFGGISGDLAGWFLQKAELWMLAAVVLYQIGEAAV